MERTMRFKAITTVSLLLAASAVIITASGTGIDLGGLNQRVERALATLVNSVFSSHYVFCKTKIQFLFIFISIITKENFLII
jgi:hypothetical protein